MIKKQLKSLWGWVTSNLTWEFFYVDYDVYYPDDMRMGRINPQRMTIKCRRRGNEYYRQTPFNTRWVRCEKPQETNVIKLERVR